jgi:hypothetical protein
VGSLEVFADEVVDLLLAGVRRPEIDDVLAGGLVVGRVFAVLAAQLSSVVVLLPEVRVLG